MARTLLLTKFKNLSLNDPFFDSLKAGYDEFPVWFNAKAEEDVYVVVDEHDRERPVKGLSLGRAWSRGVAICFA